MFISTTVLPCFLMSTPTLIENGMKVWAISSIHSNLYLILRFLEHRFFKAKHGADLSSLRCIKAGVPQGSIASPLLYTVHISDMPTDDIHITATHMQMTSLSRVRTSTVCKIVLERQLKKWRIKVSQTISVHVTFILRRETCPPLRLCNEALCLSEIAHILFCGFINV